MTIDERARKIFAILQLPMDYDAKNGIPKGTYESIAAELRAVREEALKEDIATKCYCAVARTHTETRCNGCHGLTLPYDIDDYKNGLLRAAEICNQQGATWFDIGEIAYREASWLLAERIRKEADK